MPRAARRRRLRAQPIIHLVPNIFTVASLCLGLTAIRYGLDGRFELALALLVLAGIFDGLDGRSARLLKITSKLGAQLDSLADFLSFGVAPAVLVYLWSLHSVKGIGWALSLLFATCCALRLARFNTELEDTARPTWMARFFTGVPAPAAAGCAIMPMLASFAFSGAAWAQSWLLNAVVILVTAVLMVSRVPTFSLKMVTVRIAPEWTLPTLVFVGLFVAALSSAPWLTLFFVGLAYVLSLPVGVMAAERMRRRAANEAAAEQAAADGPEGASAAGPDGERVVHFGEPPAAGRAGQQRPR
ncbi:MAG TPA: CDP-diacylglycerol--serine O-phosphatidyltransferase [Geminicoccaceae bacterium]